MSMCRLVIKARLETSDNLVLMHKQQTLSTKIGGNDSENMARNVLQSISKNLKCFSNAFSTEESDLKIALMNQTPDFKSLTLPWTLDVDDDLCVNHTLRSESCQFLCGAGTLSVRNLNGSIDLAIPVVSLRFQTKTNYNVFLDCIVIPAKDCYGDNCHLHPRTVLYDGQSKVLQPYKMLRKHIYFENDLSVSKTHSHYDNKKILSAYHIDTMRIFGLHPVSTEAVVFNTANTIQYRSTLFEKALSVEKDTVTKIKNKCQFITVYLKL